MRRVGRTVGPLLALWLLHAHPALATVLVPMSDETLVASSDAIVVGRVAGITTAALEGGRMTPSRWFDADCGDPITFSLGNVDTGYGDAASRAAVAQATAARTDAQAHRSSSTSDRTRPRACPC